MSPRLQRVVDGIGRLFQNSKLFAAALSQRLEKISELLVRERRVDRPRLSALIIRLRSRPWRAATERRPSCE